MIEQLHTNSAARTQSYKRFLTATSIACLLAPATTAVSLAQEEASLAVEEIVVTARKRAESLQDLPISVQAFTVDQITKSDISDLADLAQFAPGVALFENVDRGYGQVFIRGMSNTPPVGDTTRELASIFIDGVYYTGGVSGINTNNVERIEVIKGPQSALYGRATFSGAINFITATPGDEWTGEVRGKVAEWGEKEVSAFIEGPLIEDVLSARVSGRFRDFDGQYTNSLNGEALGEEEDTSIAGTLYITPSDNFDAKINVSYLEQRDGPPATVLTGRTDVHNFTSPTGVTFVDGVVPLSVPIAQNPFPDSLQNFGIPLTPFDREIFPAENRLIRDYLFASWSANYTFENGMTLSYLGGYSDETRYRTFDFEFDAIENYWGSRFTFNDHHSHELRLASADDERLTWLAGVNYFDQNAFNGDYGGIFGSGFLNEFGLGFLGVQPGEGVVGAGPRTTVDLDIRNIAVFGSASYDVLENLTISIEGRYQEDKLTDPDISATTKAFLPRAIIEYDLNDNVLLYASAAKGLRPTAINTEFIQLTPDQQQAFQDAFPNFEVGVTAPKEEIWSYEFGAKTTSLDGRILINVNGYVSKWTDRQDLRSLLTDIDGDLAIDSILVTVNGTDVDSWGLELATSVAVSDQFTFGANMAYTSTELTPSGPSGIFGRFFNADPDGERLAQTPLLSASVNGEYRFPILGGDYESFLRAEGNYIGTRYASDLNFGETGESFELNLRAGFENDRMSVTFFIENALNDDTFGSLRLQGDCASTASCAPRAYEAALANKRQAGVTAALKF